MFNAATANPVFYRTYSRHTEYGRESWEQVCSRTLKALEKLGKLNTEEIALITKMQSSMKSLPSGRWLWVGGTKWLEKPANYSGAYNCTSTNLTSWNAFALMMDLAMMGCGTGAVIEEKYFSRLPKIANSINIDVFGEPGDVSPEERQEETSWTAAGNGKFVMYVGDSRNGWVEAYKLLLEAASNTMYQGEINISVCLSHVRPNGEPLKSFGGVANPVKIKDLFVRCSAILNKAVGRQLSSIECCLLIDEAASTIVAGNIRRCLPGDALVHTESGLVPIAKIRIGDRVLTSKGFYPVTNFFDQGEQSLCRIKTQDGSFECTAEHKIAVLTDVYGNYKMVKAKDLKQGDRLIFVPKQIPGTATELPEFCGKITAKTKPITIPALTASTAYFIGYLHGNGSVSSDGSRVRFAIPEDSSEILDYLIDVGKEFGLNTYTVATPEQRKAKAYELQFNSTALNQYLKCIKQAFQPLNIPDCILLGKPNIREAYLSGLADADGCHSQNVLVTSVQEHFLRQVQALYASLGITTRSCSSIRKNTKKWEGELVTVGETAYNSVRDIFTKYSLQYLKQKQQTPKSFKDHGFPKAMVRPIVNTYQYGWSNNQEQMIVSTLKKYVSEATELIPVKFVDIEFDVRTALTYDIEVATVHEFVCEGILVSNSAGMRQFTSSDNVAANAKANLWEQTPTGEWRIDPEKDALRMANHTRVFHQKPTYKEVFDSVTSQYWSGEGAIQWAGEAVARANADLLITQKLKAEFLNAYENGEAKEWIRENYPDMPHAEIEHRLSTYGLNPCGEIVGSNFHCVSGDTLLITKDGLHAIKDVVGCDVEIWNGKNWSQVQPFKTGSSRVLYRVRFADGTYLDATEYHRFFVKDRFSKEYKEVHTKDLMDASKYRIHTKPFTIQYDDGLDIDANYAYSLGVAVGDGTTDKDNNSKIRLYGKKIALSVAGNKSPIREYEYVTNFTDVTNLNFSGEFLKSLKTKPEALNIIASWNREAILHFIAGLADTDGTNSSGNGIRIYISDYDRAYRIQLLLIKCGIRSSVNLCAYKGAVTNYGVRSKDLYCVQVTDCSKIPCQRLDVSKGKVPKCKGKWQVIKSVEQLPGLHDTYCFNEPQYHEGVFGNTLTGNCNLSEIHLNQLNPTDYKEQEEAFKAASLSVAALLHHRFTEPIYQESRELDPIVGVSFTGLFDFFVHAFGAEWLHWWQQEREDSEQGRIFKQKEQEYLSRWKDIVHQTVWEYCDKHNLKRPNRCTTVQPSGCLDRTALRIFDQGLLYADELIAPGNGEVTDLKLSVRDGIAVTTGIANQPLQLIKITLNNGRVLRMTPNHRLSIDGSWIYASDMTPGMKIDFSLGEYQNSQETSLLDVDQFSYTREAKQLEAGHNRGITATIIKMPKTMSPDLAYFIGALFGNGCLSISGHRIRFSSNSYKLLERLQQIAQNLFVVDGKINKYSDRAAYELSISSVQLYNWLQLTGIAKTEKSLNLDRIPLAIRCSSKQSILSFFCGLIDTDGCIRSNGSMSIDSASEDFIRNLQQIGEAVGLCFSIFHNTQGKNNQAQKSMWGLCLSRMLSKPDALDYLNKNSQKAEIRPIPSLKRNYKFDPYLIESVEWEETPDYSYDFAVQGEDDNDSWYWQGGIKSHNTKSLLTGASPGWHPPKAQQFIRRITFRKNDPVALACIDFGYSVVPSQSDKDENGNLLDNPFDERCTEWLVEIPVAVSWANLPGVDVDISKFSVLAQFDFYMQVQKYYTTHNTSATLELRQNEIGALSRAIYDSIENNDGYISAAILSRFDDFQSYPRLPFEPISKDKYLQLVKEVNQRKTNDDFLNALHKYDNGFDDQSGPAPCDSDKCLLPESK